MRLTLQGPSNRGRIATTVLAAATALIFGAQAVEAGPSHGPLVRLMRAPVAFEANRGQFHSSVHFAARYTGGALAITQSGATLAVKAKGAASLVQMRLAGANAQARVCGIRRLPGVANYLFGNDPARWRTGVPTYSAVSIRSVYPGIDLLYYGAGSRLEYDFVVKPGASPDRIHLAFAGAGPMTVAANGDLVAATPSGDLRIRRPYAYQSVGGRRVQVACSYAVESPTTIRFRTARYDRGRPLVVDPVVEYASLMGGGGDDQAYGVATDSTGCAYVAGVTLSTNFPTAWPLQASNAGGSDVFIAKINATGTAALYSTYLGGSGSEGALGIAIDAGGSPYVTGYTNSSNFPTTTGAFQSSGLGSDDGFVAKLTSDGSALVYSTRLGGNAADWAYSVAADVDGNAFVAGVTASTNFPTTAGAFRTTPGGGQDAFLVKVNPVGTALVYGTLLAGDGYDYARGVALDTAGNAFVVGYSGSTNFPTTTGAFQTAAHTENAFATKVNPTGTGLVYSTLLSGDSSMNRAHGVAVDSAGCAFVAGTTSAADFPVTSGVIQSAIGYGQDGFITKLNEAGTGCVYSTFLGGDGADQLAGIMVDRCGRASVTGFTASTTIPQPGSVFNPTPPPSDVLVAQLDISAASIAPVVRFRGSGLAEGAAIAGTGTGKACIAGHAAGAGFPTTSGAMQTTSGGGDDAVIAEIRFQEGWCLTVSMADARRGGPGLVVGELKRGRDNFTTAGMPVTFTFSGDSIGSATTNSSGIAQVSFTVPGGTTPGVVPIGAAYAGDSDNWPAAATGTALVNPGLATRIYGGSVQVGEGAPAMVYCYLYEPGAARTMVPGLPIRFVVDGTERGVADTDVYGKAEFSVGGLTLGSHSVSYQFAGDAIYEPSSATGTVTVNVGNAIGLYMGPQPEAARGIEVPLYGYIWDGVTGDMLPAVQVHFSVDGVEVGTAVSDANGKATLVYSVPPALALGAHELKIEHLYSDDSLRAGGVARNTMTVRPKIGTRLYCRSFVAGVGVHINLYAYLWGYPGRTLLAGKVIEFRVNGTLVGTAITDAHGRAVLGYTVQSGDNAIQVAFAEDADYYGSTSSGTITNP